MDDQPAGCRDIWVTGQLGVLLVECSVSLVTGRLGDCSVGIQIGWFTAQ